jgi:hypothetical protein
LIQAPRDKRNPDRVRAACLHKVAPITSGERVMLVLVGHGQEAKPRKEKGAPKMLVSPEKGASYRRAHSAASTAPVEVIFALATWKNSSSG